MSKLVLFDIDNTLIKSSRGHKAAFSIAFKKIYGIDASINIIQYSGMTDQQIIFEVLKLKGLDEEKIQSKLNLCIKEMINAWKSLNDNEIFILPGVHKLLEILFKEHFLLGLVTGNLEAIARDKMKRLGINHFFKVGGFGSEHINRTELVKIAINKAQSNFNFILSNNVYLFGDAPQDMRAAREAEIIAIGVTTGIYTKKQLEDAGADMVIDDFTNTEKILNDISI